MPELTITVPDYNPSDWPQCFQNAGADLIIDMEIVAVFHLPDDMLDMIEVARTWAKLNNIPVRWRMYDTNVILHCGIEYPPLIGRRRKRSNK